MTNKIETGGPAFPCDLAAYDDEVQREMQGMNLRDYFAAKAMQGILASPHYRGSAFVNADAAYRFADAMMKARGEK
jgi:hypothetical protein